MFRLHNGVSTRLYDELEVGPVDQRERALWPTAGHTREFDTAAILDSVRGSYWDPSWGVLSDCKNDAGRLDVYYKENGGPPSR